MEFLNFLARKQFLQNSSKILINHLKIKFFISPMFAATLLDPGLVNYKVLTTVLSSVLASHAESLMVVGSLAPQLLWFCLDLWTAFIIRV